MMRFILLTLALVASASPAWAFIPGARGIVRRFAEAQALERTSPSAISGTARFVGRAYDYPVELDFSKEGCRAQMKTSAGASVATLADGQTTSTGPAIPALEAVAALGCPLFTFNRQPAADVEVAVFKFAASLGVDVAVASMSRVNASPATHDVHVGYVVGARAADSKRPQIWFDHDTYRPLRVVGKYGGRLWDLRFVDGDSIATNRLAPRIVAVYADGVRQMDVRLMASTPIPPAEEGQQAADEDDSD